MTRASPPEIEELKRAGLKVRMLPPPVFGELQGTTTLSARTLVENHVYHVTKAGCLAGLTGKGITVAIIDGGLAAAALKVDLESPFTNVVGARHKIETNRATSHASTMALCVRSFSANCKLINAVTDISDQGVAQAVKWAIEQGANVISMSFGWPAKSKVDVEETVVDVLEEARAKGVLLLAAAGNYADEGISVHGPALLDCVTAVGATTYAGKPALWSATGAFGAAREKPETYAPGVLVEVAALANERGRVGPFTTDGTSPATAIVAGGTAAVLAKYPQFDAVAYFNARAGKLVDFEDMVSAARSC